MLLSSVRLTDQNANILYQYIRKQISNGKNKSFDVYILDLKDELELYKIEDGEKVYLYQNYKDFNKAFLNKNIEKINQFTEIKKLSVTIIERVARKATKLRFSYQVDKESEGQDYRIPKGFRGA